MRTDSCGLLLALLIATDGGRQGNIMTGKERKGEEMSWSCVFFSERSSFGRPNGRAGRAEELLRWGLTFAGASAWCVSDRGVPEVHVVFLV